jgi:integrase
MRQQRNEPGIRPRHLSDCTRKSRCSCPWQAEVYDVDSGKKIRQQFATRAAAKTWRHDALVQLRQGKLRAADGTTLVKAAEAWLAGARDGTIRNRSGDTFKPSAVRSYDTSLRLRVLPELGHKRLSDLKRNDVQELVDQLIANGLEPATIQATIIPLKSICRRELHRGRITVNPTLGLELPAVRSGRDRIADPVEGARLLAVLPNADKPIWATAMYAGLRCGELRALRVKAIDLDANVIRVDWGWDASDGQIATKGRNRRRVPIPGVLREPLLEHLMRTGRRDDALVFGYSEGSPFEPGKLRDRADTAWKAAGLERIKLHECRHTFASLMIAAGVNAKALSTYMGHATVAFTLDKYGHLMPGNEDEAAGLLDTYLTTAIGAAR